MVHLTPVMAPLAAVAQLLVGVAILLLIAASLYDIAARIIPDEICIALAVLGFLLRLSDGRLLYALIAAATVFIVLMFCCMRGWIGGGDVKLLSASVLLLQPSLVPSVIFYVGMAGGVLAVIYLALSRILPKPGPRPTGRLARMCRAELFRIRRRSPLPYGVGIAAGCIIVLMRSMP